LAIDVLKVFYATQIEPDPGIWVTDRLFPLLNENLNQIWEVQIRMGRNILKDFSGKDVDSGAYFVLD
jgi:hypothetical protein